MDRRPNLLARPMPHDNTLMRWLWVFLYAGFVAAATALFLHPLSCATTIAVAYGLLAAPFAIAFYRVRFPGAEIKQATTRERNMREHQLLRCTIRLRMRCPELFTCRQGPPRPRATMKA